MSKLTEADLPALRRLVEFCHEGNFVYPALPAGILDRLAPAAEAATGEPTDTHVIRCESGDEITVPDWNAAQARVLAGPGEPTDAELELVLDLYRAAKRLAGNKTLADVQAVIDATNEVPWSAMKRLSGARPMPDTPAPDEQDATLVKLIDLLTRTANAVKGQPGEMKQHGWADLPELCTALAARVAELEAELAGRAATVGINDDLLERNGELLAALENIRAKHHGDEAYNIACDALGVAR